MTEDLTQEDNFLFPYVLSNFSSFTLFWKNIRFDTVEAAYHWEKLNYKNPAKYVDLMLTQEAIRKASSAHEAFRIAQRYKSMRRLDWDDVKVDIMRELLIEKVKQHDYVKRKLLDTGERELVENNRKGFPGKLWLEIKNVLLDEAKVWS